MKGILFNVPTGMFASVTDGTKTMTRRIIKPQPIVDEESGYMYWKELHQFDIHNWKEPFADGHARYRIDETVFIKESFCRTKLTMAYKVDFPAKATKNERFWTNAMFCPEAAARHFIKIILVRVEKLQDITEKDAIKEGVLLMQEDSAGRLYKDYSGKRLSVYTAKESFATLINKINGKGTWERNPWIFVYGFKKVKP